MKNKQKEIERLINLKNITESLFAAIQYVYLNNLNVDDFKIVRFFSFL